MGIVFFGVVLACLLDVFRRMDQVSMGDHRVMGRLFEVSRAMVFSGGAMVPRGVLQKFRGLQMMINALLRHALKNNKYA